jgi:hypothetical protein
MEPELTEPEKNVQPHDVFSNALDAVIGFIEDEWDSDYDTHRYNLNASLVALNVTAANGGVAQDVLSKRLKKVGLTMDA